MSDLQLASEFPAATEADWRARVAAVLKAESFEEKFVSYTDDGIRIDPLYGRIEAPLVGRCEPGPWQIIQRVDHKNPVLANSQALDDLEQGASALALCFEGSPSARRFGLSGDPATVLPIVVKDIALHAIGVRLEGGAKGRAAAQAFAALVRKSALNPELLNVSFGMDPIGVLAARGYLEEPWADRARLVAETASDLSADFQGPFLEADGRIWHDAGATPAQTIGAILATGAAYLRLLESLGDKAMVQGIGVTLAVDQDMFGSLAAMRTMRLCWSRLMEACSLDARLKLHAETSWPMMTKLDPHTNILRAVAAVFGAGLGGADSISVLPFSLVQGLPDAFARRVARNLQNILIEESNLWRVTDPAAGAGYIEHLTSALCEKSWDHFQEIERQGGIVKALEKGWLQQEIARSRQKTEAEERPIIGTTVYRLPAEYQAAIERDVTPSRPSMNSALAPARRSEKWEATV